MQNNAVSKNRSYIRRLAVTAVLSAAAAVLMYLEFSVPLMPDFIKLDFSELPALLAAFSLGPVWGAAVCLIKNLIHLPLSSTGGVGELSNFLLGVAFTVPAGLIYRFHKTRRGAFAASVVGAAAMAAVSLPVNYFIVYPIYANFMPMESIVAAYTAILPWADTLPRALLVFNLPFTFVKGMIDVAMAFVIYKPLSPVIKGRTA